jgi:hypothetical protein
MVDLFDVGNDEYGSWEFDHHTVEHDPPKQGPSSNSRPRVLLSRTSASAQRELAEDLERADQGPHQYGGVEE